MPSLKSIRKRIVSVKNTQKITRAMKMVAAARLRRAQQNITELRPYAQKTLEVLSSVAMRAGDEEVHDDGLVRRFGPVAQPPVEKPLEAGPGEGLDRHHRIGLAELLPRKLRARPGHAASCRLMAPFRQPIIFATHHAPQDGSMWA